MTKVKQITVAKLIELLQQVNNKEKVEVSCINAGATKTFELLEVIEDFGEVILVID